VNDLLNNKIKCRLAQQTKTNWNK